VTIGTIAGELAGMRAGRRLRLGYVLQLLAVGAVYYGAAKLGLALSVAHGVITPVWPPTRIALAALVLLGRRMWPAVLVAAFIANSTHGTSIPVAFLISARQRRGRGDRHRRRPFARRAVRRTARRPRLGGGIAGRRRELPRLPAGALSIP
jgi:hypothetical protein